MTVNSEEKKYSYYFQALVKKSECGFLVAALRSLENVAFARTLDKTQSLFEFFVPPGTRNQFLVFISYFEKKEIVTNLVEKPNRLLDPLEKL